MRMRSYPPLIDTLVLHVPLFAHSPDISDAKYHELLSRLDEMGYDTSRFRRVPQTPEQIGKPGFQSPGDKDRCPRSAKLITSMGETRDRSNPIVGWEGAA